MLYNIHPTCQIPGLANIYQKHFGNKPDGSFLEVGAYDGISYSNTYGLAQMGWRGLYIEAVHDNYLLCIKNHQEHKRIETLHACVGDGGLVDMYVNDFGGCSTANPKFAAEAVDKWKVKYTVQSKVQTVKLDTILRDKWVGPMDLMVIDVEGYELSVLAGLTIECWIPKMVIIEAHQKHGNKIFRANVDGINAYFDPYYEQIYSDNCNNIYVRDDGRCKIDRTDTI